MLRQHLATGILVLGLCAVAAGSEARAAGRPLGELGPPQVRSHPTGYGYAPRRHRLRPALAYREPRFAGPSRGPDFLIHAYLPRLTDKPIYNEPPSHVPTD